MEEIVHQRKDCKNKTQTITILSEQQHHQSFGQVNKPGEQQLGFEGTPKLSNNKVKRQDNMNNQRIKSSEPTVIEKLKKALANSLKALFLS